MNSMESTWNVVALLPFALYPFWAMNSDTFMISGSLFRCLPPKVIFTVGNVSSDIATSLLPSDGEMNDDATFSLGSKENLFM